MEALPVSTLQSKLLQQGRGATSATACPGEVRPRLGVFFSQAYGLKTGEEGSPGATVPGPHGAAAGKPGQAKQPCCDSQGPGADLFAERLTRRL